MLPRQDWIFKVKMAPFGQGGGPITIPYRRPCFSVCDVAGDHSPACTLHGLLELQHTPSLGRWTFTDLLISQVTTTPDLPTLSFCCWITITFGPEVFETTANPTVVNRQFQRLKGHRPSASFLV